MKRKKRTADRQPVRSGPEFVQLNFFWSGLQVNILSGDVCFGQPTTMQHQIFVSTVMRCDNLSSFKMRQIVFQWRWCHCLHTTHFLRHKRNVSSVRFYFSQNVNIHKTDWLDLKRTGFGVHAPLLLRDISLLFLISLWSNICNSIIASICTEFQHSLSQLTLFTLGN